MTGATYQEVRSKSALNRSGGFRTSWTLNPYRGCVHACEYCYARKTHSYLDLDWDRDFERVVFAKVNLPELLGRELRRPSWKGQPVCIGSAADPYQPAEATYRITRRCLEALADLGNPCTILTKGTLIVRDVDVLQQLAERVSVCFSLTTLDERLARRLEPHAPPPRSRLRALERLRAAGVRAGILLCPVLPGLTDSPAQLEAVIRAAVDHGAVEVGVGALRLAPLVKDHFLPFVDREFPRLSAAYRHWYAHGAEAPWAYRAQLERLTDRLKMECGVPDHPEEGLAPPADEQLRLPLWG